MQNEIKDQKEKSVIEICIIKSKHIIQLRKALVTLNAAKTEVSKCSKRFPTEDKLKELITEVKDSIIELQMNISLLLKPILEIHGINLELKYWFSTQEMRAGYVLLRKPNSLGATHVLFLRDHIDSFDSTVIKEGEVKQYKHVNHFLERLDATTALKKVQSK